MAFCEVLRSLIDDKEITQKQLALDLHVAASTIGSYVQGVREPDFHTLKQIAQYFHVTTDYLLDNHTETTQTQAEDKLLTIFRSLTAEQQEMYIEQGKLYIRMNNKKNPESLKSTS